MFFFFFDIQYIAIIGDIRNSKELIDRKSVQKMLKSTLDKINEKYQNDIASKFMITLGDEFQGLLSNGDNIMNIIEEIEREMYPVKIRFGVGVGEITTDINLEMAIGADGPGYYRARSAIEYLKKNEQKKEAHVSDVRLEVDEDNKSVAIMINTILSLIDAVKQKWTDRQREIIWNMIKYQDGQKKVAERLGITQSSVQRGLVSGNYYAYKHALDTVVSALKEIRRKDV